ncbi:MAG TPA: RDD family protein [Campylobacterales bacterium]|nr:RDD family protein [Campylobacterales bacterium]HIP59883.1 RDD family protein [Campylobacterales bacterium]
MRWRDVKQNKITHKDEAKEIKETESSLPYATYGDKIKAFITDTFLLSMPIFYAVIYLVFGNREGFQNDMLLGWFYILGPLGVVIVLFYFISGQTPGMKAYDIKVIDNKTGEKPSLLLAILRFFFFNVVLFSFIGLFFSFLREDRRGIYDLLSGTSVIKTTK